MDSWCSPPSHKMGGQGRKTSIAYFSTKRNRNEHISPARGRKPLPLGEVALRSNDGEGKPGTKEHLHSDKHWLLIESSYRCVFVLSQHPCPLRRSAPAPPKGEPFSASAPQTCANRPKTCANGTCIGGGGWYNGSIRNTQEKGGYDHET